MNMIELNDHIFFVIQLERYDIESIRLIRSKTKMSFGFDAKIMIFKKVMFGRQTFVL